MKSGLVRTSAVSSFAQLLYAANTLEISGQVEAAMGKLSEAQALMVIEVNMANGAIANLMCKLDNL
jgi:hypothetical protein